jgi:Zn-dependent protease with chaperone function
MNFFEHQDKARRNTQSLIFLFSLAILAMIGSIYCAAVATLNGNAARGWADVTCRNVLVSTAPSYGRPSYGTKQVCETNWWNPKLLMWVTLGTVGIVGSASWYRINTLRAGGAAIAQELGGRLLFTETATPEEQELLNVVTEMAIAAGIRIPSVYLLDEEPHINAFAAGDSLNSAVIGVTRGALEQLTRDELQGVIGHEFSHILNGDMQLNLQLVGLLHGILFIYFTGRVLLSSRDRKGGASQFGIALIVIGSIGLLFGRLIKSAVSRQREFLADASAVQFTRNPDGIAGALEKLAGIGSHVYSPRAEAASHMFFSNALKSDLFESAFATHPPLVKRIQRIRGRKIKAQVAPSSSAISEAAIGFAGGAQSVAPPQQTPEDAIALIYALLNPELKQLQQLASPAIVEKTLAQLDAIPQLDAGQRLPLVDRTVPTLRQLPTEDQKQLLKTVLDLSKTDGRWSIGKFAVFLILQHRLQTAPATPQISAIAEIWDDCLNVLSILARISNPNPDSFQYAFRSGVYRLPGASTQALPETPPPCKLGDLKQSLERLRLASPRLKQAIVDACANTVMLDNTPEAGELLRAIAILLDCRVPPFLNAKKR